MASWPLEDPALAGTAMQSVVISGKVFLLLREFLLLLQRAIECSYCGTSLSLIRVRGLNTAQINIGSKISGRYNFEDTFIQFCTDAHL